MMAALIGKVPLSIILVGTKFVISPNSSKSQLGFYIKIIKRVDVDTDNNVIL